MGRDKLVLMGYEERELSLEHNPHRRHYATEGTRQNRQCKAMKSAQWRVII